jgi:hypothetical protein
MTLPSTITSVLLRSPDYSAEFTARVKELAKLLETDLGVKISHDANMNYRAGQYLSYEAKYDRRRTLHKGKGKGIIEVRIYISSKAPLFAIYCIDRSLTFVNPTEPHHPVPEEGFPAEIAEQLEVFRARLIQISYKEVERNLFDLNAPGCNTELDDMPATVFQSLFAEII